MRCSISSCAALAAFGAWSIAAAAPALGQGRPTVVFTQMFEGHALYGGDVDGQWAVIGARGRELYAWVAHREPAGWRVVEQLEPPEGIAFGGLQINYGTEVGGGVAIDRGTVFVAASDARGGEGLVVPYRLDASGRWVAAEPLAPASPRPGEHFGMAIAAHGGELAVVAQQRLVVFALGPGGWERSADLALEIPVGTSPTGVAFSGDLVVVAGTGARCESHVYRREGAIWERAVIENLCGRPSTDGTRIVGMDLRTTPCAAEPRNRCARAVVYAWSGAEWVLSERHGPIPALWGLVRWGPDGEEFGEHLGASSALAADRLILGAWLYGSATSGSVSGPGAVVEADGSRLSVLLPHPSVTGGDELDLGRELATDGRTLVVGARGAVYFVALDRGASCAEDGECGTGHCADGVCCDVACGDGDPTDCMACAGSAGGVEDGTCGPLRSGPAGERICRPAAAPCDLPETCSPIETGCPADALAPDGARCDDGLDLCAIAAECWSGACRPADRAVCEDADPSTCDDCDPANGSCTHRPCGDAGAAPDAALGERPVSGGCGCTLAAPPPPVSGLWALAALCALVFRRRRQRRKDERHPLEGGAR